MSWLALAVAALAFALALLPTRRLFLAGWRPAPLAAYLLVLMALAMALLLFRAGIRVLLPILVVLYIAPFVGAPEVVARTITRLGTGRGGHGARGVVDGIVRPSRGRPPDGPAPPAPRADAGDAADPRPTTREGHGAAPGSQARGTSDQVSRPPTPDPGDAAAPPVAADPGSRPPTTGPDDVG